MRRGSRGFTLVEVLVVLIIMGILVAIGVPKYMTTVETSRAEDAQAMVKLIAQANRMYALDNNNTPVSFGSQLNATHPLVANKYVAATDFGDFPYDYYSCPGGGSCCNNCNGVAPSACTQRHAGGPAFSSGWGYIVAVDNTMCKLSSSTPDPL